jgi:hypothetical protein
MRLPPFGFDRSFNGIFGRRLDYRALIVLADAHDGNWPDRLMLAKNN